VIFIFSDAEASSSQLVDEARQCGVREATIPVKRLPRVVDPSLTRSGWLRSTVAIAFRNACESSARNTPSASANASNPRNAVDVATTHSPRASASALFRLLPPPERIGRIAPTSHLDRPKLLVFDTRKKNGLGTDLQTETSGIPDAQRSRHRLRRRPNTRQSSHLQSILLSAPASVARGAKFSTRFRGSVALARNDIHYVE
jgi:hypothetical protein